MICVNAKYFNRGSSLKKKTKTSFLCQNNNPKNIYKKNRKKFQYPIDNQKKMCYNTIALKIWVWRSW